MVGLLGGAASLWLVGGGHGRLELHGARARRRKEERRRPRRLSHGKKIAQKEKNSSGPNFNFFRSGILGTIGDELLFFS